MSEHGEHVFCRECFDEGFETRPPDKIPEWAYYAKDIALLLVLGGILVTFLQFRDSNAAKFLALGKDGEDLFDCRIHGNIVYMACFDYRLTWGYTEKQFINATGIGREFYAIGNSSIPFTR